MKQCQNFSRITSTDKIALPFADLTDINGKENNYINTTYDIGIIFKLSLQLAFLRTGRV